MEWQGTAETYHERIELGIESFVELSYGREIGATMQLAEQKWDIHIYYVHSAVSFGTCKARLCVNPPKS